MAQKVKVLGPAAFRAFRTLWMLEELGIPYEHELAMPQSEEVKKYNPLGKIPVLIIEDDKTSSPFVMYESAAINTFLGDTFRSSTDTSSTLVPPVGSNLRGTYDQTISVLLSELDAQSLWIHTKHHALGNIYTYIPDAVSHAKVYFNKTNVTLIKQLKESDGQYLLGEHFTAADIFYVHCLDWSKDIGWDDKWKNEPILVDYWNDCKSRKAYQTIKEKEKREGPLIAKAMKHFSEIARKKQLSRL